MNETEAIWRIEEPLPKALAQGWVYLWVNGHCFQVRRDVAVAVINAQGELVALRTQADRLAEALEDAKWSLKAMLMACPVDGSSVHRQAEANLATIDAALADYRANEQPDSEASK